MSSVKALRFARNAIARLTTGQGVNASGLVGSAAAVLRGPARKRVGLVIQGQSVPHGNVPVAQLTASASGTTLNVTAVSSNAVVENGCEITGPLAVNGAKVVSGPAGRTTGTYVLDRDVGTITSQTMYATYKQAFQSIYNPAKAVPLLGAVSPQGGALLRLYDRMLADWNVELAIVNAAKGSSSLVTDWCGRLAYRFADSNDVYAQRSAAGGGDRGFAGTRIAPASGGNGPVWTATTANQTAAMGSLPNAILPGTGGASVDYIIYDGKPLRTGGVDFTATISGTTMTINSIVGGPANGINPSMYLYGFGAGYNSILANTTIVSGPTNGGVGSVYTISQGGQDGSKTISASAANFNSGQPVGTTQTDGGVIWTLSAASTGGLKPNDVLTEAFDAQGWDPRRLHQAAFELLCQIPDLTDRFVYIDGNQGDWNASNQAVRQAAVIASANWWLARGVKVFIGNQIYSPASPGAATYATQQNASNLAAYNALKAGRYADSVYLGADLYTALGGASILASDLLPDNIHLGGVGSMKMGDAMFDAVKLAITRPASV